MVYWLHGKWVAVLIDYDLSSILRDHGPRGNERTGTVPFMAINLLRPNARVTHLYQHNAESFIWVLVWVCLRYKGGKLLPSRKGRKLDDWLKVDAAGCEKEKSSLLRMFGVMKDVESTCGEYGIKASSSHASNWNLAVLCLHTLFIMAGLVSQTNLYSGYGSWSTYSPSLQALYLTILLILLLHP